MVSIILIESSCSERHTRILVARWKNAVHYFSTAPRSDSSSAASRKKHSGLSIQEKLSGHYAPINRSFEQLDASTGKNFQTGARSGPSHVMVQSALVHETLFFQVFPFFPRVLLSSPFIRAKMGLGAQEKLVIRPLIRKPGKKISQDTIERIASVSTLISFTKEKKILLLRFKTKKKF